MTVMTIGQRGSAAVFRLCLFSCPYTKLPICTSLHQKTTCPLQSFASYKNLVINGPSNPEDDKNNATTGDGWFLFTVGKNGMSADERIQYLTDVSSHFSEFLTTINTSGHVSDNLEKAIETYAQIVTLVIDGKNLGGLSAQLLKKYLDEGASSARTYIDGLTAQLTNLVTSFSTQSVAMVFDFQYKRRTRFGKICWQGQAWRQSAFRENICTNRCRFRNVGR